jgi:hypothetical protein
MIDVAAPLSARLVPAARSMPFHVTQRASIFNGLHRLRAMTVALHRR